MKITDLAAELVNLPAEQFETTVAFARLARQKNAGQMRIPVAEKAATARKKPGPKPGWRQRKAEAAAKAAEAAMAEDINTNPPGAVVE